MSEPKCSERAQALVDNFGDAISVDEYDPTLDTARDVDKTYDSLTEYIATLEHRNAALERVAEAARKRHKHGHNDTCSFALSSEYECSCGYSETVRALRALDGEDK